MEGNVSINMHIMATVVMSVGVVTPFVPVYIPFPDGLENQRNDYPHLT